MDRPDGWSEKKQNLRLTKSADIIRTPSAAKSKAFGANSCNDSTSSSSHIKTESPAEDKQDRLDYTLYIPCGLLTREELITAFNNQILPDVWKVLGGKRNVQVIVNKVRSFKESGFKGDFEHAFVRINDAEVVNVLCKLNPDGSPREEKRLKVPSIVTVPSVNTTKPSGSISEPDFNAPARKKAWWEDDDELFPVEPIQQYETIKLDPLVKPVFVNYTSPEVITYLRSENRMEDGVTLNIEPAMVKRARSGCANHVLYFNGNVPDTISERDIRPIFLPFAHDSVTQNEFRFGREKYRAALPLVRFVAGKDREGRNIRKMLIYFDSNRHDAQDARIMNLHFRVRGVNLAVDFAPRAEIYRESIEFEANHSRQQNNHRQRNQKQNNRQSARN